MSAPRKRPFLLLAAVLAVNLLAAWLVPGTALGVGQNGTTIVASVSATGSYTHTFGNP